MSDGQDGCRADTDKELIELGKAIKNYEVNAKFCVLGIGSSYDGSFFSKLNNLGTEVGFYIGPEVEEVKG